MFRSKEARRTNIARRPSAKKRGTHHGGASALGRVHVHPCCRLRPERLSPRIRPQLAARVRRRTRSGRWRPHDAHKRRSMPHYRQRAEAAGRRPDPPKPLTTRVGNDTLRKCQPEGFSKHSKCLRQCQRVFEMFFPFLAGFFVLPIFFTS